MNYPDSKDKKKQKKKPTKKLPNSNPSTLIEPSQQRVAFSNNRVQPQRARRSTMSSGRSNLSLSSGRSNLSTIGEQDLNRNQNNNSAGRRTQNLGMHTIVEEDIERILRGNGNDLLESIPGWQSTAIAREIARLNEPQRDVTVIPIENDTDTVTNSNGTNSIKCCKLGDNGICCCGIITFLLTLSLLFVFIYFDMKKNENLMKLSKLPEVSNSTNEFWDDYDIAPQKVR